MVGIGTVKIVHQLSNIGVPAVFAINIDNMFPVVKGFTGIKVNPLYMIDWLSLTEKILFRNKNRIGFRQCLKILPSVQVFHIHHAGMVPRPLRF